MWVSGLVEEGGGGNLCTLIHGALEGGAGAMEVGCEQGGVDELPHNQLVCRGVG